jgi:hypothetical protein
MNTQVTRLLNEIERILRNRGLTVADLARDIGKDYHQVYYWIKVRRFNPQADGLLALMKWRDERRHILLRPRSAGGRA